MPPVAHPISPPPGTPPLTSPVLLPARRDQLQALATAPAPADHHALQVQDIRVIQSQYGNPGSETFWTDVAHVSEDLREAAQEGSALLRAKSVGIINHFFPGSHAINSAAIKPRFAPLKRDSWLHKCDPGLPNCAQTQGNRKLIIVGAVGGYMVLNCFIAHIVQRDLRGDPHRLLYTFVAFVGGAPIFLVASVAAVAHGGFAGAQQWYRVRQEARATRREAARREAEAAERATDGIELIPIDDPPPAYLASFLDQLIRDSETVPVGAHLARHPSSPQEPPPAYHRH